MTNNQETQDSKNLELLEEAFTNGLIFRKANQLARRGELDAMDVEDIEQEIRMHLVRRLPQFDPSIGHWKNFVTSVVERFVCDLLRNHGSQKRGAVPPQSLSGLERIDDGETIGGAGALTEADGDLRQQVDRRSSSDLHDLNHDLAVVISRLTPDQQRLLELLADHSLIEAAEIMGVPHQTLSDRRSRIAEVFDEAGLRDYLT